VNVSGNVQGLQFHNNGVQVDLPAKVSQAEMKVASFTSASLDIVALDNSGNMVGNAQAPGDNAVHLLHLAGQDITKLVITGGGNEGVIVEICT